MQVKKQQLEPDMEQRLVPNWERSTVKASYCHSAYLTYIQNISCKMRGWMNHKLESSFLEAQKQKYRLMVHDRKPRDKPMQLLAPYF